MDERQLKDLMNSDPVPPADENARKRALNLALAAFDETQREKAKTRQGSGWLARLTGRSNNRPGRQVMNNAKKWTLIGGTATAAVALLGIFTYATFDRVVQPYVDATGNAVSATDKKTAATGGKAEDDAARRRDLSRRQTTQAPIEEEEEQQQILRNLPEPNVGPAAKPAPKTRPTRKLQKVEKFPTDKPSRDRFSKSKESKPAPKKEDAPADTTATTTAPAPKNRMFGFFDQRQGQLSGGAMAPQGTLQEENRPESFGRRAPPPGDIVPHQYKDVGRDRFAAVDENPIKRVADEPVSTFSVDVDTASYSFMRRMLNRGVLPQKNAVRIEELINYFDYAYPLPETREQPFKPTVTVMPSPWKTGNKLIHIGIKGYDIDADEKPRSNLVFLLDVSGSMNAPDKLPLMVNSLKLLLDTLKADDTVAIVVYAGAAGTVLEPTKVAEKHKILAALDRLRAGGTTAGAAGIRQAYALAEGNFDKTAVNRVILATDGDFNVGITNREELKGFVERKRKTGVFLSVFGFGQGNLNDQLMQTLAQNGNGVAAHIDTLNEARKVLVEEASSTLFPIAKDVKIQVEFNPATVAEYRLIGYETRALKREDFRNDKVDAGDIGAGHTVTAIYEITLAKGGKPMIAERRYKPAETVAKDKTDDRGNEYGFLKIRYKLPDQETSNLITTPIAVSNEILDTAKDAAATRAREARWATAVAAFGQILKGGKYTGAFSYDDVIALAKPAKGEDEFGYRAEFLNLVRLARSASALPRK